MGPEKSRNTARTKARKMRALLLLLALGCCLGLSSPVRKVAVTGAGGRTGKLILQKLAGLGHQAVGIVRTEKSQKQLSKAGYKECVVGDVTGSVEELANLFKGCDSVVLATSAVPKIKIWSIIKALFFKLFGKVSRPEFRFGKNGDPYNVDWLGAKNQIDAAKLAGVKQFVFLSSMGGTQPENFLNTIGKNDQDPNSGNILLWKRKAEEYLIASGLQYTIVHPGGLIDKKGDLHSIKPLMTIYVYIYKHTYI
jgi:uncharacterized protein YbjT (DUF2867 family)